MLESVSTAQLDSHMWMNLFCGASKPGKLCNLSQKYAMTDKYELRNADGFISKTQFSSDSSPVLTALTHICVFCPDPATELWGVECQTKHLWLSNRSLQQVSVLWWARCSNQETCVVLCAYLCMCTVHHMSLKMSHHRKLMHVSVSHFCFSQRHFIFYFLSQMYLLHVFKFIFVVVAAWWYRK